MTRTERCNPHSRHAPHAAAGFRVQGVEGSGIVGFEMGRMTYGLAFFGSTHDRVQDDRAQGLGFIDFRLDL